MTPEDQERMQVLCGQIQQERDPKRFSWLVTELDELLATKEDQSVVLDELKRD
jgi:hypothetical protein